MTVFASYDPTSLFAGGDDFAHRKITVLSGQGVLARGTLLGVVTASGKAIKSVATANDGSQNPTSVLADDIDATSGDVVCAAYDEGHFAFEKMIVDGSWTMDALNASFRARGSGIFLRSVGATA